MTDATPSTPFHSLDAYIALPRVDGVALSPDGERAILTVATLSSDRTRYERAAATVNPRTNELPTGGSFEWGRG